MKLGKKTHYAVVSLIYLAHDNKKNAPVSLFTISTSQGLSLVYLEKLFVNLRNAGIVQSVRGPGGGYKLDKTPTHISVWEIGLAVGEVFSASQCEKCAGDNCSSSSHNHNHAMEKEQECNHECTNGGECKNKHKKTDENISKCTIKHATKSGRHHSNDDSEATCKTYALWDGLENAMQTYLESVSLYSLLDSSKCDCG